MCTSPRVLILSRAAGLACLNHMIADALSHVPDVMSYMASIKHPKIFLFCAIPQVMAIATLAKLYNNEKVFQGVVKIRKGLSARLMLDVTDMASLRSWFASFAADIHARLRPNDPSTTKIATLLLPLREGKSAAGAAAAGPASAAATSSVFSSPNFVLRAILIFLALVIGYVALTWVLGKSPDVSLRALYGTLHEDPLLLTACVALATSLAYMSRQPRAVTRAVRDFSTRYQQ